MESLELRIFFALWPAAEVRSQLAAALRPWRFGLPFHWVRPENLHMTLAFLGEVDEIGIDSAKAAAWAVSGAGLTLSLDRVEYWQKPQVLCLTPSISDDKLGQLVADLSSRLRAKGFRLENRPFRPHVTLARKVTALPAGLAWSSSVVWSAQAFVLVASCQTGQGSRYRVIHSWPLDGPESRKALPRLCPKPPVVE